MQYVLVLFWHINTIDFAFQLPVADEILSLTAVTDSEASFTKRTSVYCFQTSNIQRMTFESKISNPTDKESLPLYESPLIANNNGLSVEMKQPIEKKVLEEKKSVVEKKGVSGAKIQSLKEGIPAPGFKILKRENPVVNQVITSAPPSDVPSAPSPRSGVDVLNMLVQNSNDIEGENESCASFHTPMTSTNPSPMDVVTKTDKPKKMKKDKTKVNGLESSNEQYHEKKSEIVNGNNNVVDITHALKEMELRLSRKIEQQSATAQTVTELNQVLATAVQENIVNIMPLDYKSVVASSVADSMEKEMKNVCFVV